MQSQERVWIKDSHPLDWECFPSIALNIYGLNWHRCYEWCFW